MPSIIKIGVLFVNSPQPNAAINVGETVINGMDANRQYNQSIGGNYGINNVITNNLSTINGRIDGQIFDQDFKPFIGVGGMLKRRGFTLYRNI
ncbi:hypothetical protein [Neobacillus vireti]|uniref:Uncharacterized protein n=1 Tax=Neobacillus vireti LMG 21834 TaxID=1131730 RepID=A0AB94IN19_9BACI|nr:hypothetical protein [Neobacillus vireti]ETI68410.1 hypothetical protein BAVI_13104 [Neobacillus vireti LMG 21834]KLT16358.1 hypothetical protein AA980_17850 [Neobacillus vireti]